MTPVQFECSLKPGCCLPLKDCFYDPLWSLVLSKRDPVCAKPYWHLRKTVIYGVGRWFSVDAELRSDWALILLRMWRAKDIFCGWFSITTIHQNVFLSGEPDTLDPSSYKIYIFFGFVILKWKYLLCLCCLENSKHFHHQNICEGNDPGIF